jgi:hypothetical protein
MESKHLVIPAKAGIRGLQTVDIKISGGQRFVC